MNITQLASRPMTRAGVLMQLLFVVALTWVFTGGMEAIGGLVGRPISVGEVERWLRIAMVSGSVLFVSAGGALTWWHVARYQRWPWEPTSNTGAV